MSPTNKEIAAKKPANKKGGVKKSRICLPLDERLEILALSRKNLVKLLD